MLKIPISSKDCLSFKVACFHQCFYVCDCQFLQLNYIIVRPF